MLEYYYIKVVVRVLLLKYFYNKYEDGIVNNMYTVKYMLYGVLMP